MSNLIGPCSSRRWPTPRAWAHSLRWAVVVVAVAAAVVELLPHLQPAAAEVAVAHRRRRRRLRKRRTKRSTLIFSVEHAEAFAAHSLHAVSGLWLTLSMQFDYTDMKLAM